ncbi:rhodanese-like domain-containing protein [Mesorhizobium sp. CA8]|uniref:rhodanese-like domain-containing protein n=1 Tax=unclassified Mesorhizobium TaxID=325217 RepID=UPI001CCE3104|nr:MULTISPECIES: rhodanese-like domain-containing protein [unclassified Mesorhizobium]MBZ9761682.1 rhodanese-like domain-containing protein [Mesorhizobium sp. CA8]MBZ9820564.1 rhodanese-like domain-containing protein [Mesorhizobium sp. CA4]
MQLISADGIKSRLDAGQRLLLVDTRLPEYFAEGHIPGAILGTSDTILERAPTLLPDKMADIAVYCGSADCKRSLRAAERLENLGYKNVFRYVEGLEDWASHGFAVTT